MTERTAFSPFFALLTLACATGNADPLQDVPYAPRQEVVADFDALVPDDRPTAAGTRVLLERVSAGVPWPRGMALVDDKLVVLARGRHRRSGGIDPAIEDFSGSLMEVDPEISEPLVPGQLASEAVARNARVLVSPSGPPFSVYDKRPDPLSDSRMDRPYCTLEYDPVSENFFVCGFAGVDLPESRFRKNASDSIHRYDRRTGRWYPVEQHDPDSVPADELGYTVSNSYYPHHDPETNPPPHGWLNGPDGCCVAGDYLYGLGKDNHLVVRYDLAAIRRDPEAGPPPGRPVLGPRVRVRHPGGVREMEVLGPSAAEYRDGWLYVGYRTSSVVLRFPTDERGAVLQPAEGELIAVFEPWDPATRRSANLIDMAFNGAGELFVSCAKEGRIWRVGVPDPRHPFYGNDRSGRPTTAPPFLDLKQLTCTKGGCGNLLFDDRGRLYVCSGNDDTGDGLAGAVYRATLLDGDDR